MKTFEVTVEKTTIKEAVITINAEDEDSAIDLALAQVEAGAEADWELQSENTECMDAEEVDSDEEGEEES